MRETRDRPCCAKDAAWEYRAWTSWSPGECGEAVDEEGLRLQLRVHHAQLRARLNPQLLRRLVFKQLSKVFHSVLLGITLGVAIYTYFFLAGLVNGGLDQQWSRAGLPTPLLRRLLKQYRVARAVFELLWDLYQGR